MAPGIPVLYTALYINLAAMESAGKKPDRNLHARPINQLSTEK